MDIDKKDIAILKVLSKDGRAQISEVSKETNIPRITVYNLSLIHISSPRDLSTSRMPSSA